MIIHQYIKNVVRYRVNFQSYCQCLIVISHNSKPGKLHKRSFYNFKFIDKILNCTYLNVMLGDSELPDDIWRKLLAFLPKKELLFASQTNRLFQQCFNNPHNYRDYVCRLKSFSVYPVYIDDDQMTISISLESDMYVVKISSNYNAYIKIQKTTIIILSVVDYRNTNANHCQIICGWINRMSQCKYLDFGSFPVNEEQIHNANGGLETVYTINKASLGLSLNQGNEMITTNQNLHNLIDKVILILLTNNTYLRCLNFDGFYSIKVQKWFFKNVIPHLISNNNKINHISLKWDSWNKIDTIDLFINIFNRFWISIDSRSHCFSLPSIHSTNNKINFNYDYIESNDTNEQETETVYEFIQHEFQSQVQEIPVSIDVNAKFCIKLQYLQVLSVYRTFFPNNTFKLLLSMCCNLKILSLFATSWEHDSNYNQNITNTANNNNNNINNNDNQENDNSEVLNYAYQMIASNSDSETETQFETHMENSNNEAEDNLESEELIANKMDYIIDCEKRKIVFPESLECISLLLCNGPFSIHKCCNNLKYIMVDSPKNDSTKWIFSQLTSFVFNVFF